MKFTKKILPALLAALMLLSSCAAGGEPAESTAAPDGQTVPQTVPETVPETEPPVTEKQEKVLTPIDPDTPLKVLFIGNSFTHYNNLNRPNGIFFNIAQNAGYTNVKVSTVYKGGYYLHQFLDETDSYGKQVLTLLKGKTTYDIVIIQEQSVQPITNPADFYDSVREFKELVNANGGQLWLYSTWGYHPKYESTAKYGPTTQEMEMKLRAAYVAIGEELDVPVIYAGAAMTKSYEDNPDINLYHTDWKHPSAAGSTLIAWTMFGTIFGVDLATLDYDASMTPADAQALRTVASYIVRNDIEVDEKFKTSSVGVKRAESTAVLLKKLPTSKIISVIYRDSAEVGNGWMTLKTDAKKTFSGIRGDKDAIASVEYSAKKLSDEQKKDIADIGYGVSVIGIDYMDSSKKGTNNNLPAGKFTSVGNLVNGHWGSSYMAAMYFDDVNYDVSGKADEDSPYTGLITLNFGKTMNFDAIGYFSGSLKGFAQAQDVYVSDNGTDWVKVPTACFEGESVAISSLDTASSPDPWNSNTPTVLAAFDMAGTSGKYIRIGIIKGGVIESNSTQLEAINTREIVVYGSEK